MRRFAALVLLGFASAARAQSAEPAIAIHRAAGPITVDGDLSDPGWKGAARVEEFWETRPGDNVAPKVRTVGYLTYDDRALYVAFECDDPDPSRIRAPYVDRDNVSSDTDYAGILLDTRHDRRTAIEFLANPRGVQYDALQDDSSGNEDTSIDLFWDSAGRINAQRLDARDPNSVSRASATIRERVRSGESSSTGTRPATRGTSTFRTNSREDRIASCARSETSSASRVSRPAAT